MNRKIGMYSAAVNAASVLAFAAFMLAWFTHGCYFASMFIAFSFVPMMCAYAGAAAEERKTAGYTAAAFDPRRVFYKLSVGPDAGHIHGRRPGMDRRPRAGVLVCLFFPRGCALILPLSRNEKKLT